MTGRSDTGGVLRALPATSAIAPRRRRTRRPRRHVLRDVLVLNLTPMLDVIFNVLLFLIVVTRFSTPEGYLPARLPARSAAAPGFDVPRVPVRVYVTGDAVGGSCAVRINDRNAPPVAPEALIAQLAGLLKQPGFDERTPVYLSADDGVKWDDVVNVYNAALAASYQRIFFVRS